MRIAIGNDHGGVDMKNHVVGWLEKNGYEVVNFGTDSTDSTDYPIYAERVAKALTDAGINADRITVKYVGDTEQVSNVREENRVAVCVTK